MSLNDDSYYMTSEYNKGYRDEVDDWYGNPFGAPPQPQGQQAQQEPFRRSAYGSDDMITPLCKCGGPFTEACCCYYCQLSRQYNIIFDETKGMNCGMCCLVAAFDFCVCDGIAMIVQCYLRDRLRKRYHLKQGGCGDCCIVWCCPCCALSQTHWELAMRGDDPGATCACGEADVPMNMR